MPTAAEIQAALIQTAHLITREPTTLTFLRRYRRTEDGAGGSLQQPGTFDVPAQQVFLSAVTRDSDYRQSSFIRDSDGERYVNHFIIVGMPTLDVEQYDEFMFNGHRFKVSFVHPERRWETVAEADRVTDGDG